MFGPLPVKCICPELLLFETAESLFSRGILDHPIAAYYRAVTALKSKEAPRKWDIRSMFPKDQDEQIVEKVASYFNTISNEFTPLPASDNKPEGIEVISFLPYQIAGRLRAFRKPKMFRNGLPSGLPK